MRLSSFHYCPWQGVLPIAWMEPGQPDKIGVRTELVQQQAKHGYVLADTYHNSNAGTARVYTILDRYWKSEPIENIEFIPSNVSVPCRSTDGRYESDRRNAGVFLKDLKTGNEFLIDPRGFAGRQCWQLGGSRFVYWRPGPTKETYYSSGEVRLYDVEDRTARTVAVGTSPTWSPDGKWIGFSNEHHYVILNPDTGEKRDLFGNPSGGLGGWSPDSQFFVFKALGGPMGGFLIWGMQCPEPYRIWVYRIRDGAADWVADSCKGPPCPVFMKRINDNAPPAEQ